MKEHQGEACRGFIEQVFLEHSRRKAQGLAEVAGPSEWPAGDVPDDLVKAIYKIVVPNARGLKAASSSSWADKGALRQLSQM
eukprot:110125-Karenia_brevis.AAC.1